MKLPKLINADRYRSCNAKPTPDDIRAVMADDFSEWLKTLSDDQIRYGVDLDVTIDPLSVNRFRHG